MGFDKNWETYAIDYAKTSTCLKSRRGAVLVRTDTQGYFGASNGPPATFRCTGFSVSNDACRKACNRIAVHAEERVIIRNGHHAGGAHLIHAKVDMEGNLMRSGPPSCWQCSRMIVDAGIAWVWLYHEAGWTPYQATEFHAKTLSYNGLPGLRSD